MIRPTQGARPSPLLALALAVTALTLAGCSKHGPSLPGGATVVVELEARVSDPSATDPTPLRDAIRNTWSERFRAARDGGVMAVYDAKVTGADPGQLVLTAKLHLATNTCTQAQASALAERVRDLATANVSFGLYRGLPEAAEALATQLRARPEVTAVTTPHDAPGALEVTPDGVGPELARTLAPPTARVVVETIRDDGEARHRVWLAAATPEMDSAFVVGAAVETTSDGELAVMVRLSEAGAAAFGELTGRLLKQPLLIVLGDEVLSAPRIRERFATTSVTITMGRAGHDAAGPEAAAHTLAAKIRYGSLPSTPTITKLAAHCAP